MSDSGLGPVTDSRVGSGSDLGDDSGSGSVVEPVSGSRSGLGYPVFVSGSSDYRDWDLCLCRPCNRALIRHSSRHVTKD